MFAARCVALLVLSFASPLWSQALDSALNGKEVTLKMDMPGTQKGVDLRFDTATPMDWKEYGKRLKQFGVALRKGDTARITAVVLKSDRIEVQLDGGGFGTFGDDTDTTVTPTFTSKSDYEKDLEKQISQTTNDDRKRSLQRDLDRERARRERQDNANREVAAIASTSKAAQVAQNRASGGSRFNLRWSGWVPESALTPDGVEQLLANYMSFDTPRGNEDATTGSPTPAPGAAMERGAPSPASRLERGMKLSDVNALLGSGKQSSQTTSPDGLLTQTMEYRTADAVVAVTYVNGIVVRYTTSSR